MEQNRPAPRRALSPKERRRRHRIRLVRNWTVFLLSCGAVMAVMTGGILWLLPRAYALIAPPTAFEAREYEGGAETDLSDKRLVLVNANLPLTEEPTPELAVADDATGVSLEAEAAAAYREMAEAAKQDEIELVLTAGYQDAAARQSAYEAAVQSYRESGCSEEEAAARAATVLLAARWTATASVPRRWWGSQASTARPCWRGRQGRCTPTRLGEAVPDGRENQDGSFCFTSVFGNGVVCLLGGFSLTMAPPPPFLSPGFLGGVCCGSLLSLCA